jgi:hypothetical protein
VGLNTIQEAKAFRLIGVKEFYFLQTVVNKLKTFALHNIQVKANEKAKSS